MNYKVAYKVSSVHVVSYSQFFRQIFVLPTRDRERTGYQYFRSPGYKWTKTKRVIKASGNKGQIFKAFVLQTSFKYMTVQRLSEPNIT